MKMLLRLITIAATACLTSAYADQLGTCGSGWANAQGETQQTRLRIRTRLHGENDAFRNYVMFGDGAESTSQFLSEETAAVEAALASGHQVLRLAARLNPVDEFLGGGWARYTELDGDTQVSRVLNINIRLRVIRPDGTVANAALGLTPDTVVSAYFEGYDDTDVLTDYAKCGLAFAGYIDDDLDGINDYISYSLSVKEDANGLIDGTACTDVPGTMVLFPDVLPSDVVDIGVLPPTTDVDNPPAEVRPVLTGDF